MNLKNWLIGALSSGLEQAAKLSLVTLTAYTVGAHLDWKTLVLSAAVGWLLGLAKWIYINPLKNLQPTNAIFFKKLIF